MRGNIIFFSNPSKGIIPSFTSFIGTVPFHSLCANYQTRFMALFILCHMPLSFIGGLLFSKVRGSLLQWLNNVMQGLLRRNNW